MKSSFFLLIVSLGNILLPQVEMNYSYEMQYGNGKQVIGQASEDPYKEDYSYLENLLDINTYIGNHLYGHIQFEYSDPPIYGYNRNSIDSMLTTIYIEYSNDLYSIRLGDQFELYGRGMSFYTFQDQNIDYDNSVMGISANYYIHENIKLSTLFGTGEYPFRSNAAERKTDYHFDTNVGLFAIDYDNQYFGYFQTIALFQQSLLGSNLVTDLCQDDNEIGEDLTAMLPVSTSCFTLGDNTIESNNINLNWNYSIGSLDVYIDKSWINYDKIYGDKVFGSRFYTSLYTDLFGIGITYEYKNYYTPYLIKSISNPPIAYREGSSILASRNAHSMNFGNEIGHQLDLNHNVFESVNVAANLSLSYRHPTGSMESVNFIDVVSMDKEETLYDYYPFRQIYMEINGWTLTDRLYYKLGIDRFIELNESKQIYATTLPTQYVLEFLNGSSLTMYLENQTKLVKEDESNEIEYTNNYLSLSYSHHGKWILTGFYDQEKKNGKSDRWLGSDFTYKLNTKTMLSFFYGSQKGGLVCANGICAEQPGFEDGVKITFRTLL